MPTAYQRKRSDRKMIKSALKKESVKSPQNKPAKVLDLAGKIIKILKNG